MTWKIPLFKIYWEERDVEMVAESIRSGMNWAIGPNVDKLEGLLAGYVGAEYALVFNSGTSALHAAMLAHGIGPGDEVIVPSFTFIATANAACFVGARPVFADIEEKSYGLDPEDVERKITGKTRAIMPIHYGGSPCLIEELRHVAKKHNLLLIEDAAESLGAHVNGKKVGTFGDSAMISFCSNKVITTGEGGVLLTDSRDIYEKAKLVRSHGRLETANYFSSTEYMDHVSLGYNFRMSNITAALGIAQMEHLDKVIDIRRKHAAYLTERLSSTTQVKPPRPVAGRFDVYQMYTLGLPDKGTRDGLMKYLADHGIQTRVYFSPVHATSYYRKILNYECGLPVTERLSDTVLTLPMYPGLTREDMDFMVDNIITFFAGRGQ